MTTKEAQQLDMGCLMHDQLMAVMDTLTVRERCGGCCAIRAECVGSWDSGREAHERKKREKIREIFFSM